MINPIGFHEFTDDEGYPTAVKLAAVMSVTGQGDYCVVKFSGSFVRLQVRYAELMKLLREGGY